MVTGKRIFDAIRCVGQAVFMPAWGSRPLTTKSSEQYAGDCRVNKMQYGSDCTHRDYKRQYGSDFRRQYGSDCRKGMKVTICGAAGETGQPLALLLKQCPLLDELAVHDQVSTCGLGMELRHVDTKCKVTTYFGSDMLSQALQDARVIVVVASDRSGDSFENNAPIITQIAMHQCSVAPSAVTVMGTEPLENTVALFAEIQRVRGVFSPRRLLGCVQLHRARAATVLADFLRAPPERVHVPLVGGAGARTLVPVLSAATQPLILSQEQVECLTSCILSGTEAVQAAACSPTATPCLARAHALARTVTAVVRALAGERVQHAGFVDALNLSLPDCQFSTNDVILGPSGIERNLGIPELSEFEHHLLCNALPIIKTEIARAVWLVYAMCNKCVTPGCRTHPERCRALESSAVPLPCAPPTHWTADGQHDCRDDYLASICREMTIACNEGTLVWTPRESDYRAACHAKMQQQVKRINAPFKTAPTTSVEQLKQLIEKSKDTYKCHQ